MRTGVLLDLRVPVDGIVEQVRRYNEQGFDSVWSSQIFGYDALSLLAVAGAAVPDIELGTAVVPVYSRLPQVMAQQALTVQAATGGRLALGIGLSHQVVVEGMWGLSFDRPAAYLREYLSILGPLLAGEIVQVEGEVLTARMAGPLEVPGAGAPPVVVAALGPAMLALAGRMADGTVTWMTGTNTVARYVVPTIAAAAREAGRPSPRVVVSLPVSVTADVDGTRQRIDKAFALYPTLPSYRAMLDREGARSPSDVAVVGDEDAVAGGLARLAEVGATDFAASIVGSAEDRARTASLLVSLKA